MEQIYNDKGEVVKILTVNDIIELHEILCNNYNLLPEMEPISPSGVKDMNMLESAVFRQMIGSGSFYKYPDPYSNCSTLVYGLVKNHAFHNGNKRIGFLALLKHSYINGNVIKADVRQEEIYDLLRCLADNRLSLHAYSYYQKFFKLKKITLSNWTCDFDVPYLSFWLKNNTEHKSTKIKLQTIPVGELQNILSKKGLSVHFDGRYFEVSRPIYKFQTWLGHKPFKKVYTIKKGKNVTLNIVDEIRKDFNLTFIDGVDNSSFYNDEQILNQEIVSYKRIIYRLAKT